MDYQYTNEDGSHREVDGSRSTTAEGPRAIFNGEKRSNDKIRNSISVCPPRTAPRQRGRRNRVAQAVFPLGPPSPAPDGHGAPGPCCGRAAHPDLLSGVCAPTGSAAMCRVHADKYRLVTAAHGRPPVPPAAASPPPPASVSEPVSQPRVPRVSVTHARSAWTMRERLATPTLSPGSHHRRRPPPGAR